MNNHTGYTGVLRRNYWHVLVKLEIHMKGLFGLKQEAPFGAAVVSFARLELTRDLVNQLCGTAWKDSIGESPSILRDRLVADSYPMY